MRESKKKLVQEKRHEAHFRREPIQILVYNVRRLKKKYCTYNIYVDVNGESTVGHLLLFSVHLGIHL